jgi:PhnB protein
MPQIQPYLFFEGRCEEAIELYRKVLGAKVEMLMRNKENPEPPPPGMPPASENKVMHASIRIGESVIMASDGHCNGKPSFQGFSLSVPARDETEARRIFAGLSEGGKVTLPLTKTFFSSAFGMATDRFGVGWMVIVPGDPMSERRQ